MEAQASRDIVIFSHSVYQVWLVFVHVQPCSALLRQTKTDTTGSFPAVAEVFPLIFIYLSKVAIIST